MSLKTLSPEEARIQGRKGGLASVKARREKKLLSHLYGDILAQEYLVQGSALTLADVVSAVLARCDSSSVALLREMREATEGNRLALDNDVTIKLDFDPTGV